jgi:ABC-type bacteriocin/lantibiotic exporter with double-glycine peptidase domain
VTQIQLYIIYAIAAYDIISKGLPTGAFLEVTGLFANAGAAVFLLLNSITALRARGRLFFEKFFEFNALPEEETVKAETPGKTAKDIDIKNVSFSYSHAEKQILKDISVNIPAGKKYALVGENGSGKTTLSKVLLGLYPPESGNVRYNGTVICDFSKESFFSSVSAVSQDFVCYNLTLRENIAVSDLSKLNEDDDIITAAANAGITGNIGLDETMGREFGGRELSGGQWQKLAIARGLFKNSELIVLDEPTSALDPLIETEILTKFVEAAKNKTAVIISHRVGLCKLADMIIVMKDGRVAETGTHGQLLAVGGEYAGLYNAQAKWYK